MLVQTLLKDLVPLPPKKGEQTLKLGAMMCNATNAISRLLDVVGGDFVIRGAHYDTTF